MNAHGKREKKAWKRTERNRERVKGWERRRKRRQRRSEIEKGLAPGEGKDRVKLLAAGIRYPRLISRTSSELFYHSNVSIAFFLCRPLARRGELFISRNGQTVFAARNLRSTWQISRNASLAPGERVNYATGFDLIQRFFRFLI